MIIPWFFEESGLTDLVEGAVVRHALSLLATARAVSGVLEERPASRVAHGASVRALTSGELAWAGESSGPSWRVDRGIAVTSAGWVELFAWRVRVADPYTDGAFHVRRYHAQHGLFGLPPGDALLRRLFRHGDNRDGFDSETKEMTDGFAVTLVLGETWHASDLPDLSRDVGIELFRSAEEMMGDGVLDRASVENDVAFLMGLPGRRQAEDAETSKRLADIGEDGRRALMEKIQARVLGVDCAFAKNSAS